METDNGDDRRMQTLLGEIGELLVRHRVPFWADYIQELETRWMAACQSGQAWAKRDALAVMSDFWGGMGSFQDFTINRASSATTADEEDAANDRLDALRAELYKAYQREARVFGG